LRSCPIVLRCGHLIAANDRLEPILLKNSVFGQLRAFWRNTVPLTSHSANIICQTRFHETVVLNYGSGFSCEGVFQQNKTIVVIQRYVRRCIATSREWPIVHRAALSLIE